MLSAGEVTLYHLTGEWGFSERMLAPSTRSLPRFRDVPLLSSIVLDVDLASSLRTLLSCHETYEGEPMRCFIPRHGLRFGHAGSGANALICLECRLAYFWIGERELHYALSESAVSDLTTLFRSAGPTP